MKKISRNKLLRIEAIAYGAIRKKPKLNYHEILNVMRFDVYDLLMNQVIRNVGITIRDNVRIWNH